MQSAAALGEYSTQEQKSGNQWNVSGFHEWIPSVDVEVRPFPVLSTFETQVHVHHGDQGHRCQYPVGCYDVPKAHLGIDLAFGLLNCSPNICVLLSMER